MNKVSKEVSSTTELDPFPEGWYFVTSRRTIEKDQLVRKPWLGLYIVAWCNQDGDVCVAEAVCPHLGSDLGPEAGGKVRNGHLVCPFHGFEFDVSGTCVATPYAPPPKSTKLKVFETCEIAGLVFAWQGHDRRPPQWGIPVIPSGTDWSEMEFWSVEFVGHPQETTENSVDLGHLRYVHGYDSVARVGPLSIDGTWLKSSFDFKRVATIAGLNCFTYDISAVANIHGLGYSFVEVNVNSFNMQTRLWVLATPIDGTTIEMTLASQVRHWRNAKGVLRGMGFLPPRLRARIMNKVIISGQKRDVLQDVVIWDRKRFLPRPLLCRSDGEIIRFRRYCEQFYPDSNHG